MVQNCTVQNCRQTPRAAGDQSPWVDKESSSSTVLCRGLVRGQSFWGTQLTLGPEKRLLVLTVKGRTRELETVQEKGKQGISKGQRGFYVTARLKDLQCLGDLHKTVCFELQEGGMLCLGSPACSKLEVGGQK